MDELQVKTYRVWYTFRYSWQAVRQHRECLRQWLRKHKLSFDDLEAADAS